MDSTRIHYNDNARDSGFDCVTIKINSRDFTAINLTIENSYDQHDSQALALTTEGDRNTFTHCKLLGYQATYFANNNCRAYLKDCFISGAVEYIYGNGTLYLGSCQIHNVSTGGYITAASTEQKNAFGFVFSNCWITGDKGVSGVYLGCPWRPYSNVVLLNCYESSCISSLGWHNWGNTENEKTALYAENNCYGAGSDITKRVDWSLQLTYKTAAYYTINNVFLQITIQLYSNLIGSHQLKMIPYIKL